MYGLIALVGLLSYTLIENNISHESYPQPQSQYVLFHDGIVEFLVWEEYFKPNKIIMFDNISEYRNHEFNVDNIKVGWILIPMYQGKYENYHLSLGRDASFWKDNANYTFVVYYDWVNEDE